MLRAAFWEKSDSGYFGKYYSDRQRIGYEHLYIVKSQEFWDAIDASFSMIGDDIDIHGSDFYNILYRPKIVELLLGNTI